MHSRRVDFYLLNSSNAQDKFLFICRLLEKAYLRRHRVFVYCSGKDQAEALDELLWTFKEDSFIPHNLQGEGLEPPPAVQIGYQQEPRGYDDILLNLHIDIPIFHGRFKRIIEVVSNEEEAKEQGRQRFRHYRGYQYDLHTHQMDSTENADNLLSMKEKST